MEQCANYYRYGGNRLADREYTIFQFFVCYSSIIFGAQSAGTIFSFARTYSLHAIHVLQLTIS